MNNTYCMRLFIISDIHGNYDALKTAYDNEKFDKLIFLGDAVDYGPEPEKVIDFLKMNSDINIMGNHDNAVINNTSCNCSFDMLELSDFTRKNISMKLLSKDDINFMRTFSLNKELDIENKKFYLTHASPYNNLDGYLFASEAEKVFRDKDFFNKYDYTLIGHTHFMMVYRNKIINPGSIGQPRDNNYMPSYAIMDTGSNEILFKRFKYDNQKMLLKLKEVVNNDEIYNKLKEYYL